jgi:hypothetical protein
VNGSAQPSEESTLIISRQHLKAVGGNHLAKESSRTTTQAANLYLMRRVEDFSLFFGRFIQLF